MIPKIFDTTRHRACLRGYDFLLFYSAPGAMGGSFDYKIRRGSRLGGLGLTGPLVCTITCIVLLLWGSSRSLSQYTRGHLGTECELVDDSITSSDSLVIILGT
ncbi:hypothetical protein K458DRAFT_421165, partial [Lentithecium fluviatile CBS 122367]